MTTTRRRWLPLHMSSDDKMKGGKTVLLYMAALSAVLIIGRSFVNFDEWYAKVDQSELENTELVIHREQEAAKYETVQEDAEDVGARMQVRPKEITVPWAQHLSYLENLPGVLAIQIGSGKEDMAKWLMEKILTYQTSHLICVDLFNDHEYNSFMKTMGKNKEKVTVWRGRNVDALLDTVVTSRRYDFVYLDCHRKAAKTVMTELCLVWPLVRSLGVIVLDGHKGGGESPNSPKPAVDAFVRWFRNDTTLLHNDEQLVVRKQKQF
ncbi:hypothetical protein CBR_g29782 [Chara braunii]|uniref:Methyltransferase domain-containing protein n=1 Tax=Chara braunii TaxID=69332 RepID=A0A388LBS2_CHABU|nr:hypothetical protein CBR_g29782 [Chara braunii]|eukprot:GBG79632.1 hypothetical protein CBR_g29782 [Chara braunii]